jgi:hypothetical protein
MCEGCGLKQCSFGLPAEKKKRWCSGCAKGHEGAVNLHSKLCEGCGQKRAVHEGLPAEGEKRRWCSSCAEDKGVKEKKEKRRRRNACAQCQEKPPTFGSPDDGRRRWCATCAPQCDSTAVCIPSRAPSVKTMLAWDGETELPGGQLVECPVCTEDVPAPIGYKSVGESRLHHTSCRTDECCTQLFHRTCLTDWLKRRASLGITDGADCPMCRGAMPQLGAFLMFLA